MRTKVYKLGEYKIIESLTGELSWEAHFGFGALQEGRCFRKGQILFMGPAENDRPGFLKAEFMDHLKRLPAWLKTKYYCRSPEVYHCKTGKRVTKVEMRLWMLKPDTDQLVGAFSEKSGQCPKGSSTGIGTGNMSFRLQRYEIIRKADNHVVWKTYAGPDMATSGNCIIFEDILFIGSRQNEQAGLPEGQFLARLQDLPQWDQTGYYCPKLPLHDCGTGNRIHEEKEKRPGERKATATRSAGKGYKRRTAFKLKRSYLSKNRAVDLIRRARKRITYAAAWVLLILLLFFDYLVRRWKERKERRHFKKSS